MEPIIQINSVSKAYKTYNRSLFAKKIPALCELSLQIQEGEVFGLIGPNGAGKSTIIKILLNLIYPDLGGATVLGKSVSEKEVRKAVGYLPENPYFCDHLTAEELLWFGGRSSGLSKEVIRQRTDNLLRALNLHQAGKRPLRTYSKGMVQRAGLALALIHDPQVMILDEPMSGLDPIGRKMVVDLIQKLKREGKTVFFSSHILSDIERLCDRVGIIVDGRLRLVDRLECLLAGGETLEELFMREVRKAGCGEEGAHG